MEKEQLIKLIKSRNAKTDYHNIKKVLILNDYCDLIREIKTYIQEIKQLYVSTYIFEKKGVTVHWNDKYFNRYDLMWKENNMLQKYHQKNLNNHNRDKLDLFSYDIIFCRRNNEEEILSLLLDNYGKEICSSRKYPAIYSFKDIIENKRGVFETVDDALFKDISRISLDEVISKEIQNFKKEIDNAYIPYIQEKHDEIYKETVDIIKQINRELEYKEIKKILVLDDYNRKFFIGDTIFWLKELKSRILDGLTDNGELRINCSNKERYTSINVLFNKSFGDNIELTNLELEDLQLCNYDLILCHADNLNRLLNYLAGNYSGEVKNHLKNTVIYYFVSSFENTIENNNWNFTSLLNSRYDSSKFFSILKNLRKGKYSEMIISKEERNWADEWLKKYNVKEDDKIIVLPDGASTQKKTLKSEEYVKLVKQCLRNKNQKVLLFDENRSGKKQELMKVVGEEMKNVIVAEGLNIRAAISLMASKHIKAIIGPCTGLMHLANCVYYYLFNNNIISKKEIPLMVVYTGSITGFYYHPRDWWQYSLVKCGVLSKTEEGKKLLIPLNDTQYSKTEYSRDSLPLSEMTSELIVEFINNISNDKNERVFVEEFN